ncbi:MAG: tRNA uracil 4-sulfurtransferase ThiI [Candidatus Micrarchaeaceae archaeon]
MEEIYPNDKVIILNFGELWLRGRNRNKYIMFLIKNLKYALNNESYSMIYYYDRIIIKLLNDSDQTSIEKKISNVFGLSGYEIANVTLPNLKSIEKTVQKSIEELKERNIKKVKINSHRSFKEHKFNSIDVIKVLSEMFKQNGIEVLNKNFDLEIYISITKEHAFIYQEKIKAQGGLPVGTSGKCIILLSGGIDSPVAAWFAMKRGLQPIFVHVHAYKTNDEAYEQKIGELYKILSKYATKPKLYVFPSTIFQAITSQYNLGRNSTVILKSFMLKIADKISKLEKTPVIYTGESLGQVSSQTSWNLFAESYGIKSEILRPLIGLDKEEIVKIAKKIGTFDVSTKEYKDVCTINYRTATTSVNFEEFKEQIKKLKLQKVISRTLKEGKLYN